LFRLIPAIFRSRDIRESAAVDFAEEKWDKALLRPSHIRMPLET
jgi:hypothetical protein